MTQVSKYMVKPPAGIVLGIVLGTAVAGAVQTPVVAAGRSLPPAGQEAGSAVQVSARPQLATQIQLAIEQMEAEFVALVAVAVLQAPNEASRLVATLAAGDRILVTGRVAGRDWYRVYLEGTGVGYLPAAAVVEVHGEELAPEPSVPEEM